MNCGRVSKSGLRWVDCTRAHGRDGLDVVLEAGGTAVGARACVRQGFLFRGQSAIPKNEAGTGDSEHTVSHLLAVGALSQRVRQELYSAPHQSADASSVHERAEAGQ